MVKTELMQRYLANVKLEVTDVNYTKCPISWRDIDFVPSFNRMYLICEGEGRIDIDGIVYYPLQGELVIMPTALRQSYRTISEQTYEKYWIHFLARVGERDLFQLIKSPYCIKLSDKHFKQAAELMEQLKQMDGLRNWTSVLGMQSVMMRLLELYLNEVGLDAISMPSSQALDKLNEVLLYMRTHMSERLTVQQLAEVMHLHPNYFISYFREHIGESPVQYMNRMRVEQAKQLLLSSTMSITEIAASIGMDVYYFSRVFKQSTGFSPSVYKGSSIE